MRPPLSLEAHRFGEGLEILAEVCQLTGSNHLEIHVDGPAWRALLEWLGARVTYKTMRSVEIQLGIPVTVWRVDR